MVIQIQLISLLEKTFLKDKIDILDHSMFTLYTVCLKKKVIQRQAVVRKLLIIRT